MKPLAHAHYLEQLKRAGVGHDAAVREADAKFRGLEFDEERFDARLEKHIEHDGDVMMQKAGFEVIRFSHPGKTRQTPGIPDRRYYRRPRETERPSGRYLQPALVVWVEYKSASGKQRPGQKLFQEMCEACGEPYVRGGLDELSAWLKSVLPGQL